jgi:hypothetical protein
MRLHQQLIGMGLLLALSGCALIVAKESQYLQSAQDRATQAEVKLQLGAPKLATTTPTGESLWLYEVREIEPGSQNTWASAGSWCDEYRLTFDSQGVLRRWTHKSYFHGGELMPASCNSTMGVEKPAL